MIRVNAMPVIISLLAFLLLGSAAQAENPIRHGRALAKEYCAGCHAIGRTGKSRHAGAPPFRTLGRSFDLDEFVRVLVRGILPGHPDMPAFKFSVDDAKAMRDYLRTIQQ